MRIAGIILIVLQCLSFISAIMMGDNIFAYGLANLVGRCIFGIIGAILLMIAHKREKRKADGEKEKED